MSNIKKLPSTHGITSNFKKLYELPLLRNTIRGNIRLTPHDRPRVQSRKYPIRYLKSVTRLFQKANIRKLAEHNIDYKKFGEYVKKSEIELMRQKGFTNPAEDTEKLKSQTLNTFKFNSPSYKRFNTFYNKLKDIENIDLVVMENFKFLLDEAKREIQGPNPDEMTAEYFQNAVPRNDEEYQFMLSKYLDVAGGVAPGQKRYKCCIELLNIIKGFQTGDDLLKISVIQFKDIFEVSLFVEDVDLANALRVFAGRALYSLGKIDELTLDKQYNFITALIDSAQYGDAQVMLDRQQVERPMWYQLKAINAIRIGNMDAAETYIQTMKKLFKVRFVQGDVYVALIGRYAFVANYERAEHWRKEFEACIEQRGMTRGDFKLSYHVAPPKEKCEYLDKFHPLGGITYLMIIGYYIANKPLNDKVSEMIEFYLKQPNTKPQDLENVFLSFRYELSAKIKPELQKLKNKQAEKYLLSFIERFQKEHPLVAYHEEFLNELLDELAEIGGFQSITHIIEHLISQKQKPTAVHFNSLIKALLKRDKVEHAFKVLEAMEGSHMIVDQNPHNPQLRNDSLLPAVNAHHYAAFLKYYSKTGDYEGFNNVVQRFKEVHDVYNTVFLTQILNTLSKVDKFPEAFEYIDQILINNIHLQDTNLPAYGYLKLYTTIWKLIKDLSYSKDPELRQKVELPDIRYVFMKMIYDNVVPTQNLYDTVLTVFINEKDYYGAVCVLQYLGKIHRTLPHKYTVSKIKKLCKFVKFNDASKKVVPKMDPIRRFEVDHKVSKYQESFDKIKAMTSNKVTLDPFAPAEERPEGSISEQLKRLQPFHEEADRAWRTLLQQMMTVVQAQEAYNRDDLIRVHDDFGLDYEADRVVKEQEEKHKFREQIRAQKKEQMKMRL